MALEIEGKITRKLPVQKGTSQRGEWSKQEFILSYRDGNYDAQICMNVWGPDRVKDFERYQIGDNIKVSISLSSREFNGRWYTDVRAWRIEPMNPTPTGYSPDYAPTQAQGSGPEYAPTQAVAASTGHGYTQAQAEAADAGKSYSAPAEPASSEEDDLPF